MDKTILESLLADSAMAGGLADAVLLADYLDLGSPRGDPLFLSLGETWAGPPGGLTRWLAEAPPETHGYQLSMYGLPALRSALLRYLVDEHRLDEVAEPGRDFEVAAVASGTRGAMSDFGRYLADRADRSRRPVVVAAGPSWDYEGVFAPLGYAVEYFPVRPEAGFRPDPADFAALADDIAGRPDERLALVVLNAQHNPTAVNWAGSAVRDVVRRAVRDGAAILVDDAYAAVYDEGVASTPALRIVLEELADAPPEARRDFLAVRSLGKQFRCNGWGLGAVVADPATLDVLVHRVMFQHSLTLGGAHQYAMARYLTEPDAAMRFLGAERAGYRRKRDLVRRYATELLGYQPESVPAGDCTSYQLLPVPAGYAERPDGVQRFRLECFRRTGVLLAPAWMGTPARAHPSPYVRVYLGPDEDVLTDAMKRMVAAEIHNDMVET